MMRNSRIQIRENKRRIRHWWWVAILLMMLAIGAAQGAEAQGVEYGEQGLRPSYGDLFDSHWARPAILELSELGILKGYPDGRFRPEKSLTYGEWIKMMVLAESGLEPVQDGNWAKAAYNQALEQGILTRRAIPEAKLPWPIPREDMALILDGLPEVTKNRIVNYEAVAGSLKDVEAGTDSHHAILRGYFLGLYQGYPDGTFRPEGTLTRAEGAQVLSRALALQQGEGVTVRKSGETTSDVLYPITDFVSNLEEYRWDTWKDLDQVRILTPEEANLRVRVPFTGRLSSYDHTLVGFMYVIQKGKIVQFCNSAPYPTFVSTIVHMPLEEMDAILCVPSKASDEEAMTLVKQPFRGGAT